MKKSIFSAIVLILVSLSGRAQNWQWGRTVCDAVLYSGQIPLASDAQGNVYMTGGFCSNSLWKYNALGDLLWTKEIDAGCVGNSLATDTAGNVYMTGNFTSFQVIFGNDTLVNHNPFPINCNFVVKYDSSGKVLWDTACARAHLAKYMSPVFFIAMH